MARSEILAAISACLAFAGCTTTAFHCPTRPLFIVPDEIGETRTCDETFVLEHYPVTPEGTFAPNVKFYLVFSTGGFPDLRYCVAENEKTFRWKDAAKPRFPVMTTLELTTDGQGTIVDAREWNEAMSPVQLEFEASNRHFSYPVPGQAKYSTSIHIEPGNGPNGFVLHAVYPVEPASGRMSWSSDPTETDEK